MCITVTVPAGLWALDRGIRQFSTLLINDAQSGAPRIVPGMRKVGNSVLKVDTGGER